MADGKIIFIDNLDDVPVGQIAAWASNTMNMERGGGIGQAASAKGRTGWIAIPTKLFGKRTDDAFLTDEALKEITGTDARSRAMKKAIDGIKGAIMSIKIALADGKNVYMPSDGFGTGEAQLRERAPELFAALTKAIDKIVAENVVEGSPSARSGLTAPAAVSLSAPEKPSKIEFPTTPISATDELRKQQQALKPAPDIQKGMVGDDEFYYHYTEAGNGDKIVTSAIKPDADGRIYFFEALEAVNEQIFNEISTRRALEGKPTSDGYDIVAIPRLDLDVYEPKRDYAAPDSSAMYVEPKAEIRISDPYVMYSGQNEFVAGPLPERAAPAAAPKASEAPAREKSPSPTGIVFTEDTSTDYAVRTRINATESDMTIAYASDYSTAGEKATAREVTAAKKQFYKFGVKFGDDVERANRLAPIYEKNAGQEVIINIAGNGEYQRGMIPTDQLTEEIAKDLAFLQKKGVGIVLVRSGGQTGADEAGVKAAAKLGIPAKVLAPKGWKFRTGSPGGTHTDQTGMASFLTRFKEVPTTVPTVAPAAPSAPVAPPSGNARLNAAAIPNNIYSAAGKSVNGMSAFERGLRAALTNPTSDLVDFVDTNSGRSFPQDSYGQKSISDKYPVVYEGKIFPSAEHAFFYYQNELNLSDSPSLSEAKRTSNLARAEELMGKIIAEKLRQHPRLVKGIETLAANEGITGEQWIAKQSHYTGKADNRQASHWTGDGLNSGFLRALSQGYSMAKQQPRSLPSLSGASAMLEHDMKIKWAQSRDNWDFFPKIDRFGKFRSKQTYYVSGSKDAAVSYAAAAQTRAAMAKTPEEKAKYEAQAKKILESQNIDSGIQNAWARLTELAIGKVSDNTARTRLSRTIGATSAFGTYYDSPVQEKLAQLDPSVKGKTIPNIIADIASQNGIDLSSGGSRESGIPTSRSKDTMQSKSDIEATMRKFVFALRAVADAKRKFDSAGIGSDSRLGKGGTLSEKNASDLSLVIMKLSAILKDYADPALAIEAQKMQRFGGEGRRGTLSPGAELASKLVARGESLSQDRIEQISKFSRRQAEAYARAMGIEMGNISEGSKAYNRPLSGEVDHSLPEQRFIDSLADSKGKIGRSFQAAIEESYGFRPAPGERITDSAKVSKAIATTMRLFPSLAERVVPTPSGFTRSARGTSKPIFQLEGGYGSRNATDANLAAAIERESIATKAFAAGEFTNKVVLVRLGNILKSNLTVGKAGTNLFDELTRIYLSGDFAASQKRASDAVSLLGPIAKLTEVDTKEINPLEVAAKYRENPSENLIRKLNTIEIALDYTTASKMGIIGPKGNSLPGLFAQTVSGIVSPQTYVSSQVRVLPGGAVISTDPAYIEAYGFPKVLPYVVESTMDAKNPFVLKPIKLQDRGMESPTSNIVPTKSGGDRAKFVDYRREQMLREARGTKAFEDIAAKAEELQGGLPKGRGASLETDRMAKLDFIISQIDILAETPSSWVSKEIFDQSMQALRENMTDNDFRAMVGASSTRSTGITTLSAESRWNLSKKFSRMVSLIGSPELDVSFAESSRNWASDPVKESIDVVPKATAEPSAADLVRTMADPVLVTEKYPTIFAGDRSKAIDDLLVSTDEIARMTYRLAYALGYGSDMLPLGAEPKNTDIRVVQDIAATMASLIDSEHVSFAETFKTPMSISAAGYQQQIVPDFQRQAQVQLEALRRLEAQAKFKEIIDPETGAVLEPKPANAAEPVKVGSFAKKQLLSKIEDLRISGGLPEEISALERQYQLLVQGERVPEYEKILSDVSRVTVKPSAQSEVTAKSGSGVTGDPLEEIATRLAAAMVGDEDPSVLRNVIGKSKLLDLFNEGPEAAAAAIIKRAWAIFGDKATPDLMKELSFNYDGREYFGTMGVGPDGRPIMAVKPQKTNERFLPSDNPLQSEPSVRQDTAARKSLIIEAEKSAQAGTDTGQRDYLRAEDRARTTIIRKRSQWNGTVSDTILQLFSEIDKGKLDATVRVFVDDLLAEYVKPDGTRVTYDEVVKRLNYGELVKSGPYNIAHRLFDHGINGDFKDIERFVRYTQDVRDQADTVTIGGRYARDLGIDPQTGRLIMGGADIPDAEIDQRTQSELNTERSTLGAELRTGPLSEDAGFHPEVGSPDHNAMMAYEQGKMFAGLGMPWTKALSDIGRPLREAPGSMGAFHGRGGFGAGFAADAAYMAWKGYLDPTALAVSAGFNSINFLPMKYAPKVGLIGAAANLGLTAVTGGDMGRAAMMTIGGLLGGAVGAFGGGFGAIGGSFAGSEIGDYIWSDVFGNKNKSHQQLMPNFDPINAPKTIKVSPHFGP